MRFNDVHKQIVAALQVDGDTARELRGVVMGYYSQGRTANFCLTMARLWLAEKVKREDAERVTPAAAAGKDIGDYVGPDAVMR